MPIIQSPPQPSELVNGRYHDLTIGLDYVYLNNGFQFWDHDDEDRGISFQNMDGLIAAVAALLVASPWPLRGQEMRFLRTHLDMTLKDMASRLDMEADAYKQLEQMRNATCPEQIDADIRKVWLDAFPNHPVGVAAAPSELASRMIVATCNESDRTWSAEFIMSPDGEFVDQTIDTVIARAAQIANGMGTLGADILTLIDYAESLSKANEKARKLLEADLTLLRMGKVDGCFEFDAAGRAIAIIAGHFCQWLEHHQATNYTETQITHGGKGYVMTIQRRDGQTPHQIRKELEEKLRLADEKTARLERYLEQSRQYVPTEILKLAEAD